MWKDLTLKEKAEIMRMSVANGVTDINDIQQLYDDSIYAEGGHLYRDGGRPNWSHDPASMIEHFEGFRESPYRDGTAWSVGYGQYMKGYGANLDWNALLSGRKKLSRSEAHQQVLRTVEDLKRQLRRALGDKLYNSLTPGQLMGYLDTGYQRPASMIQAAQVHRTKGAEAAASVLGVNGFADRNAARRAAFTGNWNNYKPTGNANQHIPNMSTGADYNRQMMNNFESPAFQPIALNSPNTSSVWMDYVSKIGQQRPVSFNTPIGPSSELLSNNQINIGSVDFSNIGKVDELMSFVDPYTSKQALEYNLGLENNALWNSPYLLFNEHSAANGGHLYDTAGQMLIRNNAVNPALQYVYGPEYEEIIRQRRNWRPSNRTNIQRTKPKYDIEARGDVTTNTVRPVQRVIRRKQTSESPARRAKEQQRYNAMMTQYRNERQGTISQASNRLRHPDYDPVKANQVQQRYEQNEIAEQKAYNRRALEHNVLEGMEAIPWPSTVAGSLFNPNTHWYDPGSFFTNLYSNDNRGFFNFNQATRDFYDANPEVGSIANLVGDFVVPGAAAKVLKGASRLSKFATADIGDAWKTMRYELTHPEAQTLGITPNANRTRQLKQLRDKIWTPRSVLEQKLNKTNDLINNVYGNRLVQTLQSPYGDIKIHADVSRWNPVDNPLSSLEADLVHAKLNGVPMEDGFNLMDAGTDGWGSQIYSPSRLVYTPKGGNTDQTLNISNSLERVSEKLKREAIGGADKQLTPQRLDISQNAYTFFNSDGTLNSMSPAMAYSSTPRVSGVLKPMILDEGNPIRMAAKRYVDHLENRLIGADGTPLASVEGSYRAVANGLPHSPNDIEFLIPEENLKQVRKIFNIKSETPKNNGFGSTVTADEFNNLPARTADFEIIKNGPNGGAIGNTAWELYQYMHPEEAQKLATDYLRKVAKTKRNSAAGNYKENCELPMTAKELFKEYMDSGLYKNKYLYDTIGAPKDKYVGRRNDLGLAGDPKEYLQRLTEKIHSEFPGTKTLKEQGYKLDYTNVEANKAFLNYFGLPEEYATDPLRMEIIVEQQMHAYTTVQRGANISIPHGTSQSSLDFVNTPIDERIDKSISLNVDAGGGNASGPGGNSTNQIGKTSAETGLTRETEIVRQLPLTYSKDKSAFKTPEDIVNRLNKIKDDSRNNFYALQQINSLSKQSEVADMAKSLDLPFYTADQNYSAAGNYIGILGMKDSDIANAIRYNGDVRGGGFEITKPFNLKSTQSWDWPLKEGTSEQILKDAEDMIRNSSDYQRITSRGKKLRKMRNDLYVRQQLQDATKSAGKAGAIATGIGIPGYYAYRELSKPSVEEAQNDVNLYKDTLRKLKANSETTISIWQGMSVADYRKLPKNEQDNIRNKLITNIQSSLNEAEQELKQAVEEKEERHRKWLERQKKRNKKKK